MSKLLIAAAGAGKTTYLVNRALENKDRRVLITTFTDANTLEIKKKIYHSVGCIPANIYIMPWFTFLLKEMVRPYQSFIIQNDIRGIVFVNKQSTTGVKEKNWKRYYLSPESRVYSDKLAKLAFRVNEKSKNLVINRLKKIYSAIYIDEVQDLAGYDFEIIRIIVEAGIDLTMVGDPRQSTYSTHYEQMNCKYKNGDLSGYIKDKDLQIEIDQESLQICYRSNFGICTLANQIYPDKEEIKSGNDTVTGHDGIFFIKEDDVLLYCKKFSPVILRYNSKSKVINPLNTKVYNFGESKGLTFNRVLVYPTRDLCYSLLNQNYESLKDSTRAKSYVAVTRAKYSVAFVLPDSEYRKFAERYPNRCWTIEPKLEEPSLFQI